MEKIAIFILLPSAVAIGFIIYYLGLYISNRILSDEYIYIQRTPIAFWGFLGVVLGIGFIRIPMTLIYKAILKDEYEFYFAYTNLKYGWDELKVWKVIEIIICSVGILFFILGMNCYVRIDTRNDTIDFKPLLSLQSFSCSINDISEIRCSPKNKRVKEVFTISIDTTYVWDSKHYNFATDVENDFIHLNNGIKQLSNYAKIPIIGSN